MRAIVTSIGEPTTDLCVWALERNGFDVELIQDDTILCAKLKRIYEDNDEEFVRVDADVIVNRNFTPELLSNLEHMDETTWWWQFETFDWYKQDINHTMAFIQAEAIEPLRENIDRFMNHPRPETMASRIDELHKPRRMNTYSDVIMGIHGYGIKDLAPVKELKAWRKQSDLYDFELAERLNKL